MLKEVFTSLLTKYSTDQHHINSLWNNIVNQHTYKNRYYHNLTHLENIYTQLQKVKTSITDWDIQLFAIFYHDYVYNILKKDNENKSAKIASEILSSLSIQKERIILCNKIILATKGHHNSKDKDVNYFIDADLSILGSSWEFYKNYYSNVRKEYKYYPDYIYNKGRIQVLNQFLNMSKIFKTEFFFNQFEEQAKENIVKEINLLSNAK